MISIFLCCYQMMRQAIGFFLDEIDLQQKVIAPNHKSGEILDQDITSE